MTQPFSPIYSCALYCILIPTPTSIKCLVQIPDESFRNVLDRVATTSDFAQARDNVLYFVRVMRMIQHIKLPTLMLNENPLFFGLPQRHLGSLPSGLSAEDSKLIKSRIKITARTMEAMTVLDTAKGLAEEEDH